MSKKRKKKHVLNQSRYYAVLIVLNALKNIAQVVIDIFDN